MYKILLMKVLALLSALIISGCSDNRLPWDKHGKLGVSEDGHFLAFEDGTPFFWVGETSWAMHQNMSREDIIMYLDDTKAEGFNVIQLMSVNTWALNDLRNYFGDRPFIDDDATKLNPPYWEFLGWAIDKAAERGLYVLLVYGSPGRKDNHGPVTNTAADAYKYGNALGSLLKQRPNLIWSNGIDVNPDDTSKVSLMGIEGWNAMAEGVTDGVSGNNNYNGDAEWSSTLMTYHPRGNNSSAQFFHEARWLDFNGTQLGYSKNSNLIRKINSDFMLKPSKPIINIEPWYEGCTWKKPSVNDLDMRQQAYQSIFVGAKGFTYGHTNIYYFNSTVEGEEAKWKQVLNSPGRIQMRFFRNLFDLYDVSGFRSDNGFVISPETEITVNKFIPALLDINGKHALVYSPEGKAFTANTDLLRGKILNYRWFNPVNGDYTDERKIVKSGEHKFEPPLRSDSGNDWVLCITAQ